MLSGAWFGLALLGLWRRRRRGLHDRILPMLACVPFLTLGLQSYGGEITLRVFLFSLPGVCVLAACAFFPAAHGEQEQRPIRRRTVVALMVWALTALSAFSVARYGNERFEQVTGGEVAAMSWVYHHDIPSARLLYLAPDTDPQATPAIPWNQQDMERIAYTSAVAPRDPTANRSLEQALTAAGPQSYLLVSSEEGADLELNAGYGQDWYRQLRTALDRDPRLRSMVSFPDAALYELATPPRDPVATDIGVGPPGPLVGRTRWTWIGLVLLAVLVPLLFLREPVWLRAGRAGRLRPLRRRPSTLFALVAGTLVLAFLVVVLERFAVLG
jgi:hypothetical protein